MRPNNTNSNDEGDRLPTARKFTPMAIPAAGFRNVGPRVELTGNVGERFRNRGRGKRRNPEPIDSEPISSSARIWKSKREIAAHLGCTERHINTLMRRRILPYIKHRGFVRFDLEECDRALEVFKTRSHFELPERRPKPLAQPPVAPPLPPGYYMATAPVAAHLNQQGCLAGVPEIMTFNSLEDACANWAGLQGRLAQKPHRRQVLVVLVVSTSPPAKS